jgi:hypothetical protein
LLEKTIEHMARYRTEIRRLTRAWCRAINPNAECWEDLRIKDWLPWRNLVKNSDYNESKDAADFDDLVGRLMRHGMRRVIKMMDRTRLPITEQILECEEILDTWRNQPKFRYLEYRFYGIPEFRERWSSGHEAVEYLQSFTRSVYRRLETTRMALCGLDSVVSKQWFQIMADTGGSQDRAVFDGVGESCKNIIQLEYQPQGNPESVTKDAPPDMEVVYENRADKTGSQDHTVVDSVEEFCRKTVQQEYERQEYSECMTDDTPPDIELIYGTILLMLTSKFQQSLLKLESVSRKLFEARINTDITSELENSATP